MYFASYNLHILHTSSIRKCFPSKKPLIFPYFFNFRYCKKTNGMKILSSNTLKILPITSEFINESAVTEDITYSSISEWENFFLSSINRNMISMIASPLHHKVEAEKLKRHSDVKDDMTEIQPVQKQVNKKQNSE